MSTGRMTIRQADLFSFYLSSLPQVKEAKVYERTGDAVIVYTGERSELIRQVLQFRFDDEALKTQEEPLTRNTKKSWWKKS